ncbi:hypothetical protein EGW08_007141 [Elysia chlorotica]|uniref:Uncharacterized protein n=1 Tax=Elysia chlorotica TaxID=188477 RepID=A0A433TU70_ELYCH|nr:hypothetical protein EGW08_007141 [Elysia chlorotica]
MAVKSIIVALFGLSCLLAGISISCGSSDDCLCSCLKDVIPTTEEERKQYVEEETKKITKELVVPKKNLSSTARKKESATDDRPSAQNVGYMGITMLCMACAIILAMDANYILQIVYFFKRKAA